MPLAQQLLAAARHCFCVIPAEAKRSAGISFVGRRQGREIPVFRYAETGMTVLKYTLLSYYYFGKLAVISSEIFPHLCTIRLAALKGKRGKMLPA